MTFHSNIRCDCYGCTPATGRHPGCHSTCEKYKDFRKRNDEVKKKELKALNGELRSDN